MNLTEYIYLINRPDAVHDKQTEVLGKIVHEFPYFQSARALYLKGLYNQNSFKYNYALKITAAHTADRSVLFDFITSDTFTSINKYLLDQKLNDIAAINVHESEVVKAAETEPITPKLETRDNSVEQSIISSITKSAQENGTANEISTPRAVAEPEISAEAETLLTESTEAPTESSSADVAITASSQSATEEAFSINEEAQTIEPPANDDIKQEPIKALPLETDAASTVESSEQQLDLGQPLQFEKNERHSFQEWLQLSKFEAIDRNEKVVNATETAAEISPTVQPIEPEQAVDPFSDTEFEKQKKNQLIDRFIQASPKIPPVKSNTSIHPNVLVEPSMADNTYLMTETLARVYLEQKKFSKAIQAYEILILKYPEKSSFFADRILDIKNLQQNHK